MSTIVDDLNAILTIENGLTANKVSPFAYTATAYNNNDVNGVTEYNVNAEQNIPVGTPEVMKINASIPAKGWRAQASAITRMLMNHFLGRISYNLNKVNDNMSTLLSNLITRLGASNGIAVLDESAILKECQLPLGTFIMRGTWNASTNTPELADGSAGARPGDVYRVIVAGSHDFGNGTLDFNVGDIVYYHAGQWRTLSKLYKHEVHCDVTGGSQSYSDISLIFNIWNHSREAITPQDIVNLALVDKIECNGTFNFGNRFGSVNGTVTTFRIDTDNGCINLGGFFREYTESTDEYTFSINYTWIHYSGFLSTTLTERLTF